MAGFDWLGTRIAGVVFDMDGVIADTRQAHVDAWRSFFAVEGFSFDAEEFTRSTFGRGNMDILPEYYPERKHDRAFIAAKSTEKESHFIELLRDGRVTAVAGVTEYVRAVRERGVPVAVGSSAPKNNIAHVLENLGLADAFSVVVGMEDATYAKPHPEIFLKSCERLGLAPESCVVFEDSIHGLEAARRAGCIVVGVATMHAPEELAALSDMVISDFSGMPGLT